MITSHAKEQDNGKNEGRRGTGRRRTLVGRRKKIRGGSGQEGIQTSNRMAFLCSTLHTIRISREVLALE
jgi:hypothetical protein